MKKLSIMALMILLGSCATNIEPFPSGGSKADGVVNLSYTVSGFQKPVIDWDLAQEKAIEKCNRWGLQKR